MREATPSTNVIFGDSYANKLRATLRLDMKLRSLIHTLDKRRRESLDLEEDKWAAAPADRSGPVLPGWLYVGGRTYRPQHAVQLGIDGTDDAPDRALWLRFRVAPGRSSRSFRARAYLLDADALARLWHVVCCGEERYQPPTFAPGSPVYDPATRRLVVPGDRRVRELFCVPFSKRVGQLESFGHGWIAALEQNGALALWHRSRGLSLATPHAGRPIHRIAALPDGRIVSAEAETGRTLIWDGEHPEAPLALPGTRQVERLDVLDANRIAVGQLDGQFAVYETRTGKLLDRGRVASGRVAGIKLAADGSVEAWGLDDDRCDARVPPTEAENAALLDQRRQAELFAGVGEVELTAQDPAGQVLAAVRRGEAERAIMARDLDRATDLDEIVQKSFRDAVLKQFHAARQLASFPEIDGTVEPDKDGWCRLEAAIPGRQSNGGRSLVDRELLQRRVVVVLALDLPDAAHELGRDPR